jgi:transcriptional regulator with XRE-family HTH domain
MKTRGQRIKEARGKRGLTLERVAGLVGCSKSQVHHLERGNRRGDAGLLARLEDVLGLQPGSLARAPVADLPAP